MYGGIMSAHKKISISNLVVNIENPRYEMVGSQHEAILLLVKEQKNKLLNLSSDIIEYGLNPSEMPIVAPHEKDKGMYNVLEGNRRIVALKLLHNPDLAKESAQVYKRLKELSLIFRKNPINEIECVVFLTPTEANRWVKLKHTGENDGVGVVKWDAQQTARFDERISGKSPVVLQAIDFLKKSKTVPADIKSNLKNIPSTNLDRLLRDKGIQELLGISIEDGHLQTRIPENEVAKGLIKIVDDLIQSRIKVKDIYTKSDREKYIESFKQTEIPQKDTKVKAPWELASHKIVQTVTSAKKREVSLDRRTLIPKGCVLQITDKRINKIYRELKDILCDDYENAVAVLFRVFVELSLDHFLDKNKKENEFSKITVDSELKAKVTATADYFQRQGVFKKHELKGIRVAVSNQNNILSMETFNAYVHNRHFSPISKDLKTGWDNIQPFIQRLWE
jgi:hypothetical protein